MPNVIDIIQLDPQLVDPASPVVGSLWYNSATDQVMLQSADGAIAMAQVGAPGSGGLVQEREIELQADTQTTSTTWADLLTLSVTTTGGALLLYADISATTSYSGASYSLRVTVDGVAVKGAGVYPGTSSVPMCGSLTCKKTVAAGTHTVKLQWRVSRNTLYCQPVSQDDEHATLLVEEVSV